MGYRSGQNIEDPEFYTFIGALATLCCAGIAVAVINAKTNVREKRLATTLTYGLWNFQTKESTLEAKESDVWGWRKLVCAGVMIAASIVSILVKRLKMKVALYCGGIIFSLWIVFIYCFWHTVVIRKYDQSDDDDDDVSDGNGKVRFKDENDNEWKSKRKITSDKGGNMDNRLPVTIITGFLGSGKTTLVNNILSNTLGMKILVIENEIGNEGIDHDLLLKNIGKEEIILMNNGCICCTVRKDLLTTFHGLFSNPAFSKLDWVVIETTGLADPGPLMHTLYMDNECKTKLRLDSVLTMIDSKHFPLHLSAKKEGVKGAHGGIPEAMQQVAFADIVLINKVDLVSEAELEEVKSSLSSINPIAQLIVCERNSKVPIAQILNVRAFDASKNKGMVDMTEKIKNGSESTFQPISIQRDKNGKILKQRMNFRESSLLASDKLKKDRVCTISLTSAVPLDLHRFNLWIAEILRVSGENIYRCKGILWIDGYDEMFVFQGIHMIFEGEKGMLWEKDSARASRLVFIGINLFELDLQAGFESCKVV